MTPCPMRVNSMKKDEVCPEDANPPDLPWRVSRFETPVRWFRHEIFAQGYAVAMNKDPNDKLAMDFVQSMPDDPEMARAFLEQGA